MNSSKFNGIRVKRHAKTGDISIRMPADIAQNLVDFLAKTGSAVTGRAPRDWGSLIYSPLEDVVAVNPHSPPYERARRVQSLCVQHKAELDEVNVPR